MCRPRRAQRPPPQARWLLLVGWPVLAACAVVPPPSAAEQALQAMACADPMFGGGASCEQRLFTTTHHTPTGDPVARAAFVRRLRERADADALDLAREVVAADLAAAVAAFVASPAASALWAAEGTALGGYPWHDSDFVAQMLATCSDPAAVGSSALSRAREVLATLESASPSPATLSLVVGASRVQPEQARAIAGFAATAAGAAWFAARATAFAQVQQRIAGMRAEAERLGFLAKSVDLADFALPRAQFADESAPAGPALTLVLDAAGCWRVDGDVVGPAAEPGQLREGLVALRQRGLAAGRLSLTAMSEGGRAFEGIAEVVRIEVPAGTAWAPIGELMKLCSEPSIAFWRLDLAADPAIVPPSFLSPARR